MDNMQLHKKKQINNYINSLDLNSDIDVEQIKKDLHQSLGEEPGIKLNYVVEEMLVEDGQTSKKLEKLESIDIIFTIIKTVSDNQGGTIEIPVPITEKYVLG